MSGPGLTRLLHSAGDPGSCHLVTPHFWDVALICMTPRQHHVCPPAHRKGGCERRLHLPLLIKVGVLFVLRENSHTIKFTPLKCTVQWFFNVFTRLCSYLIWLQNVFITPEGNPEPIHSPFPAPLSPWQLLIYFLSLWIYPFRTFHIN